MINNEEQLQTFLRSLEEIGSLLQRRSVFERVPVTLYKRALQKSADYAEKNMPDVILLYDLSKFQMYQCALSKLTIDGYFAEFGVFEGRSINYIADLINPNVIFGFDSFLGLEEDMPLEPKGSFNLNGILPNVRENVQLIKGLFENTLPVWLNHHPGPFSFINIDSSTYNAASTILNLLGPERIVKGTHIIFDEYFGFHGWENQEFKAWKEYCLKYSVKYKYIALNDMQALVEVL